MNALNQVLVVIRGGIAEVFANRGVQAVIADLDNLAAANCVGDDVAPLHASYKPLLDLAQIDYPTSESPHATQDEAWHPPDGSQATVGQSSSPLAPLGVRLFKEIEATFETVSGIVEEFGLMSLVDLWWLANVLLANPGELIEQSSDSRILELLARLPSGQEFSRHVITEFGQLI